MQGLIIRPADADDLAMMLDPRNWEDIYYAAEVDRGELVGCFQFTREGDTPVISLGLRPDLTGRGTGLPFVQAGLEFACGRYAPRAFRLSVARHMAGSQDASSNGYVQDT